MPNFGDLQFFTPLIQLFAGVNFTYILVNISKELKNRFTPDILEKKISHQELESLIATNATNLSEMKEREFENDNEKAEESLINELIETNRKVEKEWTDHKNNLKTQYTDKITDFTELFLFVSIFCVIDLLFISLCSSTLSNIIFRLAFAIFQLFEIYFIVKISTHKEEEQKDIDIIHSSGKKTLICLTTALTVPILIMFIPSYFNFNTEIWCNEHFIKYIWIIVKWIVFIGSIIIPILPIIEAYYQLKKEYNKITKEASEFAAKKLTECKDVLTRTKTIVDYNKDLQKHKNKLQHG